MSIFSPFSSTCVSHFVCAHFSGPGPFTINSVSIGTDRDLVNMTYMEVSHFTIRRHGSDVYLGMSPVQNGGSYLMY